MDQVARLCEQGILADDDDGRQWVLWQIMKLVDPKGAETLEDFVPYAGEEQEG